MTYEHLIKLADNMTAHLGRSEATIAKRAGSHARLFDRLRNGRGCNFNTYRAVLGWFHLNWPDDLEWPSDVPRPKQSKTMKEAG